jgi:hypothetical protein
MSDNDNLIPQAAVKGVATGLCLMAFFTLLWSGIAYRGLHSESYWALLLLFPALTMLFIINAVKLYRIAPSFPPTASPDDIARRKNTGKWFGIIFGAEGLGIFIAINIVTNIGHPELHGVYMVISGRKVTAAYMRKTSVS